MSFHETLDNSAEKHLKQYAQMIDGLLTESKRIVDFGDYAGMTFSQIYSEDYVYCSKLLRLKPKTITMLLFQGYIQKMNFIYKPDVRVLCSQYSSMKSSSHSNNENNGGNRRKMKAIEN